MDEVLRALQQRNIQLSIDDFGTGYSALSYLHTLPVSCLKVDRSFVQPITAQPSSLGVVPLIINIARTMGMQVIAEGIENRVQLKQLQQLGCEYGQGYLFSKGGSGRQRNRTLKSCGYRLGKLERCGRCLISLHRFDSIKPTTA